MSARAITKAPSMPSVFEDFFKPWSQWFDDGGLTNRRMNIPAVNIKENGNHYTYIRWGDELRSRGLYLDEPAWKYYVFLVEQ